MEELKIEFQQEDETSMMELDDFGTMQCKKCRKLFYCIDLYRVNARFCPFCGRKLQEEYVNKTNEL